MFYARLYAGAYERNIFSVSVYSGNNSNETYQLQLNIVTAYVSYFVLIMQIIKRDMVLGLKVLIFFVITRMPSDNIILKWERESGND